MIVLPKKGVLDYFGELPSSVEIEDRKNGLDPMDSLIEEEFDYIGFIQQKCWELAKVNADDIIKQIDQKLDRANWGNDEQSNKWKTETKDLDNDAWIFIDRNRNQIREFNFRADLREANLKFLYDMIGLASEKGFLLADRKGNLVEPDIKLVFGLVKRSNALRFVENPTEFWEGVIKGVIKIE